MSDYTTDVERFPGLNVHDFNAIKGFASRCAGQKCLLFSIIKERCLYSQKNFHDTVQNLYVCLAI